MEKTTIEFRGMPLFERGKMQTPSSQQFSLPNFACFFYIVEGEYHATDAHGAYKVGKKEALVKRCGNFLAQFFSGENGEKCEAVAVYLYPDLLHEIYKNEVPEFITNSDNAATPKSMIPNQLIDRFINNLFVYFDNPSMIDEELALLKLKELVMLLLRSEQYESVQQFLSDIFSPSRLKFTSIIENNLYNNLSMEDLAFICSKSLSSFKREFKKEFNETPARYIKMRRLERAAQLLKASNDSISGIAFDCGFQDATTFSASFQERYGMSASVYRT